MNPKLDVDKNLKQREILKVPRGKRLIFSKRNKEIDD